MNPESLRVAAAQYDVGYFESIDEYRAKIQNWIAEAVRNAANLLVFPEYFSMELASLFGSEVHASLSLQLESLQSVLPEFREVFQAASQRHGVHILAGSFPEEVHPAVYRNRSYLFFPDGRSEFQDKLQMTRFENERWSISPGDETKIFETQYGRLAVNICYDSQFPMHARRQVEAGADLILVPSCTDALAGYHRVRIGCQARALENQCYVVQSSLVGDAPWTEAVDRNVGAAGVYAPADRGFPDDGVLVSGELNQPGWVYADLDPERLARVRKDGQVLNYRDWNEQFR